jgi:DNA-binding XRE family transcriptional regulator
MGTNIRNGYIYVSIKFLGVRTFEELKNLPEIKALATHIRVLREKAGMSQQELADTAEISKLTIQRVENAKYSITIDTLISISNALNIPLKKLVDF